MGLQAYPFCDFFGENADQQSSDHSGDQKSRSIIKKTGIFYDKGSDNKLTDIVGNASGNADAQKAEAGELFHKGHDSKA